jgi:hypothetical protein
MQIIAAAARIVRLVDFIEIAPFRSTQPPQEIDVPSGIQLCTPAQQLPALQIHFKPGSCSR